MWLVGTLVVAGLVGAGVGAVVLRLPASAAAAAVGVVQTSAPMSAPMSAPTSPPSVLPEPATTAPVRPPEALRNRVDADSAAVEALSGSWVPQLSSKAVGTVDDGWVYDEAGILAAFDDLRLRYPTVLLLRSETFSSFRLPGFWVAVVGQPFPTADAANQWCDARALPADACFAKHLSHTEGPSVSTVHR